jgi:hypothetical protein
VKIGVKALYQHLADYEVQTVIDVDLANYFGSISHPLLVEMLREKIGDERLIRYLIRMFKAGVLTDGELTVSDEGLPQGSIWSPPTMLHKRVVSRGKGTVLDSEYHVDPFLVNLNALDQRFRTSLPVGVQSGRLSNAGRNLAVLLARQRWP